VIEPLTVRVERAAALLDCGISSIKALISSGELESIRIGGMRLIRYQSLKKLVNDGGSAAQKRNNRLDV
jgi:excisionase family DNA binding protein